VLTVAVKEWSWLHENPMRNVRMPRMPSGYLIVDDPVVAKSSARLFGEAAWVWSSKDSTVVFGVAVGLLVWTDGQVRIPLAFRCWHQGGPSTFALELLSYTRNRLRSRSPSSSGYAILGGIASVSARKIGALRVGHSPGICNNRNGGVFCTPGL
jgi:hypothetical protein